MARFTKLVLVLISGISLTVTGPSKSEAGIIPWTYDAIFGPVGSLRASGAGYAPTYAGTGYRGYSSYGLAYSAFTPVTVAYTPMTVAYTPTIANYGGSSCGCSQSANYLPYNAYYVGSNAGCCNSCNSCCNSGCSTGGCSSGTCSNCTTGGSSTSGYPNTPTPDPYYNGKNNSRESLEERLRRLEYGHEQQQEYLKEKHEYVPKPYNSQSSLGGTTVPQRPIGRNGEKIDTFGSDREYSPPKKRQREEIDPLDPQERNKPDLGSPTEIEKKKSEDTKTGDPKSDAPKPATEKDVETRRLLNTLTARAVAPRERMQSLPTTAVKAVATKSTKNSSKSLLDSSLIGEISRH